MTVTAATQTLDERTTMARRSIDCRDHPDDTGCTLYLSGGEDEVIRAAAEHAASVHGMTDNARAAGAVPRHVERRSRADTRVTARMEVEP